MIPVYVGRRLMGTDVPRMVRAPLMRPAPPIPAIARPVMSIQEATDAPQMAEPISKIAKKVMKVHWVLNFW